MNILKKNKYILKKNKYILKKKKNKYILSKGNPNPNHFYYDLYITLRTLGKLFEVLSYFKIYFEISRTSLKKISTVLKKKVNSSQKYAHFFQGGLEH